MVNSAAGRLRPFTAAAADKNRIAGGRPAQGQAGAFRARAADHGESGNDSFQFAVFSFQLQVYLLDQELFSLTNFRVERSITVWSTKVGQIRKLVLK